MASPQQNEPLFAWLALFLLFAIGAYGMWLMNYRAIAPAIMAVKQYELYPIKELNDDAKLAYNRISQARSTLKSHINMGAQYRQKEVWQLMVWAANKSGEVYRYPVAGILFFFAFWSLFIRKGNTFKVRHTLESLMKVQALSWPFITPFLKYNPSKSGSRAPGARVPIELPMFAEAFYPEEWMAHFRIRMINGVPDRDQIRRALLWQLGGRFTGIDNLPEHIYCLLAAIAMKGAQKRKESDEFLGEVAKCWDFEEGFNVSARVKSLAAEALHNPKIVEPLLDIMNKHAFVTTAMLAALSWARRQGGVLAPAQFVWLRGHDRLLWYPLNNLGRRAFHVEASGAMAHYQAELEAGRPLKMPRLDSAVVAIVQYLSETRARIPEIEGGEKPASGPQISGSRRPDTLQLSSNKAK